jgi:Fe-S cluster assembly protein SufD
MTTERTKAGAASVGTGTAEIPALPAGLPAGPKWLEKARGAAWTSYHEKPMPDRAAHLWRYSDPAAFLLPADATGDPERTEILVSPAKAAGVTVLPLAVAAREMPDIVRTHLGGLIPTGFGKPEDLNGALWSAGTFVRIPRGVKLEDPIRLLTTVSGSAAFRAIRNLVIVEEGASAIVVEESRGTGNAGRDYLNEVTEIFAAPESRIRYIPLQHLSREAVAHRTARARLDAGANLLTVIASFGAASYKADLGVSLEGPGAESKMTGLCFGVGKQRADHHTVQDHVAGHTLSDIDFRVVLNGHARSAYTGLIRIAQDAPYCEAFQENRNLLLADTCRAESIPELEILTDEVRCKHGATVGPIDQDQLFYLASRGLPPAEATRMVISGFLEETLRHLPEDVADSLREEMTARLKEI